MGATPTAAAPAGLVAEADFEGEAGFVVAPADLRGEVGLVATGGLVGLEWRGGPLLLLVAAAVEDGGFEEAMADVGLALARSACVSVCVCMCYQSLQNPKAIF